MKHNILITGGSGYLGGTLLANWKAANLSHLYDRVFALVRTAEQEAAVKQYGATPIRIDLGSESAVAEALLSNGISVVGYMIGAWNLGAQASFFKALAEVKAATGRDVHYIFSSGAKLYSAMAGAPAESFSDTDGNLYEVHKAQKARWDLLQGAVDSDVGVIDLGNKYGVKTYTFVPCIVYGRGEGFGNKISIQTVDVTTAALATGHVFRIGDKTQRWPVSHVKDTTALYLQLLRLILSGADPGSGKRGFYLASSGSVAWDDLYAAVAAALAKRGRIASGEVRAATEEDLKLAAGPLGLPADMVELKIAGHCAWTPEHGRAIGWEPMFEPEHVLEAADDEVQLILDTKGV